MKNTIQIVLSSLALSGVLLAQAPGGDSKAVSASKVERKNKAPVSTDVLRVTLPKPVELKLPSGLTVLVLEDHRLPTITLRMTIQGAGSLNDPPDVPGVANLTATMLKEGTYSRTSKKISEDIDRLGATIIASAPFAAGAANFNASGLSDNVRDWMNLAADILLNPTFLDEELAKLKQRVKVQMVQQRSSPFFLIQERFNKAVYGDHPAASVSFTPESLDKITREMLVKWHHERYVPQNALLGIAGDIKASQLQEMFSSMPNWEGTDRKADDPPATKAAKGRKIYLVDRPGSVQADVRMGNIAVKRADPDYVALAVMDRIVGGGAAARLFMNLREEKGYTYGAYSGFAAFKYAGPWFAFGNMRTDATDGAMTEFLKELNRIRDQPVPESELEEDKRSMVASFALSLEDPAELLTYAMTQRFYGLPADYWDTYPAKIMNVTAEQVQRVAQKYIVPDDLQIAAVGDASKIKTVLEKYGPVEVYGTDGKKK